MKMRFEWSSRKGAANKSKHGVSCEEALTVFADPLARIFDDLAHSEREHREIIICHSKSSRLLVVAFVETDSVRVISARPATKVERLDYEESSRS